MVDGNRNIRIRLMADTASFQAGLAKASRSASDTATQLEKGGKKSQLLTNGLALAGGAAVALGAAAIGIAANFDQSMSEVQAATRASNGEIASLREAAIDAGAQTVYSASEAADGITELGKAGMSTTDILSGGLSGALDLAASDGMAVGDAAELMASSLAQFNLRGSQATMVADALAAGAGNAQGSAHDLGLALNQSGLVANSMGISMQQTTGALSAFANAGMIGSDAGTSLKTMLQRLAAPTEKSQQTMDELGISAYDAQGNFVGLSAMAGQLQKSMSGMSQEQRNAAMNTIFGADAVRAANVLYSEGQKGIDGWTKKVSDTGYASEQAAARTDNLKGDIEQLGGSFETFMITLGEGGQGPLRMLTQGLTDFVNVLSMIPAPISQSFVMMTALAGGVAAAHKAFGNLTTSSSTLAQGLGKILDPWSTISNYAGQYASAADNAAKKQVLMNAAAGLGKAALIGLAAAAAAWVASMVINSIQNYTQGIKDYADAMKDAKSEADKVSSAQDILEQKFMDSSKVESTKTALDALGMTWDEFADAMTSGGKAADDVSNRISEMLDQSQNYDALGKTSIKLTKDQISALSDMSEGVRDNSRQISEAKKQDEARNSLLKESADASGKAADANGENADATSEAGQAAEQAASQLSEYIQQLFQIPGMAVSSDQALTNLNQSILDTTKSITENGVVLDANGTALANHQAAAYEAQSGLQGIATAAQNAAQKILEEGNATGDMSSASEEAGGALETARAGFVKAAQAAGMSSDQANALANKYGLTRGKVDELVNSMKKVPAQVNSTVSVSVVGAGAVANLIDQYGRLNQQAMSYQQQSAAISQGKVPAAGALFHKAGGGMIYGRGTGTSDSNLAAVSKGEYIIRERSASKLGLGTLNYLNENGVLPHFMLGGAVSTIPTSSITQAAPQKIMVNSTSSQAPVNYVQNLTIKQYSTGSGTTDTSILVSKIRSQTNTLLQGGR